MLLPPTGSKGRPITGRYEKILREGGPLPDRHCDCTPPKEWSFSTTERDYACRKGQSCIHVVSRLLYVMVARGWSKSDIADAVSDSANVGLLWLYWHDDDDELDRQHARAVEAVLSVSRPDPKRRKRCEPMSEPFQYRYAVWHRLFNVIEANPGCGVRDLRRLMCNNGGGKMLRHGHLDLYLEKALAEGYLGFTLGPRNKHEHFVITRPEPPAVRPYRDMRKGEDMITFAKSVRAHQTEHREWLEAYRRQEDGESMSLDEALALIS